MHQPNRRQRALRVVAGFLIAMIGLFTVPTVAFASAEPGGDVVAPVAVVGDPSSVTLTPVQWTLITGLVLPFIIAIVVKAGHSARFKGVVAILIATVAALVERSQLADGSAIISSGALVDVLFVYGPQLLTYLGLWQHFQINDKLAPNFGI